MQGFAKHQNLYDMSVELILKLRHKEGLDEALYSTLLQQLLAKLEAQRDSGQIDKGIAYLVFTIPYMMENQLGVYNASSDDERYIRIEAAALRFREEMEAYFDGFRLAE